jgi:hypothetical protein
MDIPIRAEVWCHDGVAGRSTGVVFNAAKQVTHLLVQERGWQGAERIVPVRHVLRATDDVIFLGCTRLELMACDPFEEHEFVSVPLENRLSPENYRSVLDRFDD